MAPIVVGVADFKNQTRALPCDGSDEPASLILHAIHDAISDTGIDPSKISPLRAAIDDISIVRPWSWPYPDLTGLLARRLEISPKFQHVSPHGGNQPAKLLDEACRRIEKGQSKVAVIAGGEALDTLKAYAKAQKVPPPGWTAVQDINAIIQPRPPSEKNLKGVHGVGAPIQVYPMYENGLRASEGKSFAESNDESASMYAEFSQVSKNNVNSWNYGKAATKHDIGTVSKKNRMICMPYPLLMNAFNDINIAGACVIMSTEHAEELGIPREKWVYVLGGAGTAESDDFYMRTNFHSSKAIDLSIDAAFQASGLGKDDMDFYDFYSCFPVVPKLACRHLGLPTSNPPKPITLLGGLTSFGGAGNNYSMHAISEMSRQLRERRGRRGLILANGGVLSYQHAIVLSADPGKKPYPSSPPLPEHCDELPSGHFAEFPEGEARIETYTVDFGRDGLPARGHVVGRLLKKDIRFIANHGDENTLNLLASMTQEPIGRRGWVRRDPANPGRNLFVLTPDSRL